MTRFALAIIIMIIGPLPATVGWVTFKLARRGLERFTAGA